jgi:glutathione S-transferase
MLTVHHLGLSQSERIVWLCEELELPYHLQIYQRDPRTRLAPAEYKALHPMQLSPVIQDGEVLLAESGAIIEYLLARYGDGRLQVPVDAPNFPDYLFWFHFANGTFLPSVSTQMLGLAGADGKVSPFVAVYQARTERAFALLEQQLGKTDYLAGAEFTAADIINVFGLSTLRAFTRRSLDGLPAIGAYLARIGQRPAYRRAMEKGDPGLTPMLA